LFERREGGFWIAHYEIPGVWVTITGVIGIRATWREVAILGGVNRLNLYVSMMYFVDLMASRNKMEGTYFVCGLGARMNTLNPISTTWLRHYDSSPAFSCLNLIDPNSSMKMIWPSSSQMEKSK